MRTIIRNAVIVVVVLLVAVMAMNPPSEKLRRGKDLAGGVSLVYGLQIDEGEDPKTVISRTIPVIKERLDPNGVLDISVVPQGNDRIEITMPLPSEEVKSLKAAFEAELEKLGRAPATARTIDAAMALPASEREAQLVALSLNDSRRLTMLREAAAKYDDSKAQRAAYEAQTDAAVRESLVGVVATAELEYEKARDALLRAAISPADLRRALLLSNKEQSLTGLDGAKVVLPSPRAAAIEQIRKSHPESTSQIDAVINAWNTYETKRKTLDDASDLIRIMRGAGVPAFRITVDPNEHPEEARLRQELKERGPRTVRSQDAKWCKVNDISGWYDTVAELELLKRDASAFFAARGYVGAEYHGEYYMLCWDTAAPKLTRLTSAEGDWSVARAGRGTDRLGRPNVIFGMDPRGAALLAQLTSEHVQKHMAVLLDDQVYTAPTLQSTISANGEIVGNFSNTQIDYIVRVLSAGALAAKLTPEPISTNQLGPEFGKDNLDKGLRAGIYSFIICAAFMVVYYFFCGFIAVFALILNCVLLVGVMALNNAAFSLPGIAGVILTFAMAVDANVLIYERMREELNRGEDLKTAVRLGYQRALPAVADGNMTNLIVCIVLASIGTPEIKGFGITMTIGILTTLFTQLFVTRLVFDVLINIVGWKKTTMLPMAIPAIQRAMTLNIDWMKYRGGFYTLFAALFALAIGMVFSQGSEMFDTEFRGGTEVTLQLKKNPDGSQLTLKRKDVEDLVAEAAASGNTAAHLELRKRPNILVVNPENDGITSHIFKVKTLADDAQTLTSAISTAFMDVIDTHPQLRFDGDSALMGGPGSPVHPVIANTLGEVIRRPGLDTPVGDYIGGVAIVLNNIEPRPSLDDLDLRLTRARSEPSFADSFGNQHTVILLEGTAEQVRSAVILARSDDFSYLQDEQLWQSELRDKEAALVKEALTETQTALSIRSFSPAVAESFVASAITAFFLSASLIIIYVWVRFGAVRFALAAIVPTINDCFIAVGLIAVADVICAHAPSLAASLGLMPFKIDLTVVAAVLTILGYSINDKIVVLDRIRENRGKLKHVNRTIVNDSINQVISRTIMTGTTTILSTFILYVMGGEGVRAFAYSLGLGVIVGTLSSIALGAPLVWSRKHDAVVPEEPSGARLSTV